MPIEVLEGFSFMQVLQEAIDEDCACILWGAYLPSDVRAAAKLQSTHTS